MLGATDADVAFGPSLDLLLKSKDPLVVMAWKEACALQRGNQIQRGYRHLVSRFSLSLGSVATLKCEACENTTGLKLCSGCKTVRYCSDACSTADWKKHKKLCGALDKMRELSGMTPVL